MTVIHIDRNAKSIGANQLSLSKLISMQMTGPIKSTFSLKRHPQGEFKRISQGEDSFVTNIITEHDTVDTFVKNFSKYHLDKILKVLGVLGVFMLSVAAWALDTSMTTDDIQAIEIITGHSPKIAIIVGMLLMMLGISSFFIDFGNRLDNRLIGGVLLLAFILSTISLCLAVGDGNEISNALKVTFNYSDTEDDNPCSEIPIDFVKSILAIYDGTDVELDCANLTTIYKELSEEQDETVEDETSNSTVVQRVKRRASKPRFSPGMKPGAFFKSGNFRKYEIGRGSAFRYSRMGGLAGRPGSPMGRYHYRSINGVPYRRGVNGVVFFGTGIFKSGSIHYLSAGTARTVKNRLTAISVVILMAILIEMAAMVSFIKTSITSNRVDIF